MANKAAQASPEKPKAPVVLIWNQPRVRLIHAPISIKGRAMSRVIRLNPGTNEISAAQWEILKARADVQDQLKKGHMRLVASETGAPLSKIPKVLDGLKEEEALILVDNTMDEVQLQAWGKSERRKPVSEAIKAQIEKIKAAVPPEEK